MIGDLCIFYCIYVSKTFLKKINANIKQFDLLFITNGSIWR